MNLNINDEQGIELLHFIFEREFKPPFSRGEKDIFGDHHYYNRDYEYIGFYSSRDNFMEFSTPIMDSIHHKVCTAFGLPYYSADWWKVTDIQLKSWMENQINIKLDDISF